MKKFWCLIVIVMSILILPACAQVEYFLMISQNGKVSMGISSSVDSKIINAAHEKDPNSPTMEIVNNAVLTVLQKQKEEMEKKLTGKVEVLINVEQNKQENVYVNSLVVNYDSMENYQKASNILAGKEEPETEQPPADIKPIKKSNWFITKQTILKTENAFYTNLEFINKMQVAFNMLGLADFNIENSMNFVQTLAYPNQRVKSNATRIIKQGDTSVHIYEMKKSEMINTPIELYINYPILQSWFFMALILTAICMVGYIAYVFLRKHNDELKTGASGSKKIDNSTSETNFSEPKRTDKDLSNKQ